MTIVTTIVPEGEKVADLKDNAELFDKLLREVQKDPTRLDRILAKHADLREELEPFLRTALFVSASEPPVMKQGHAHDARIAAISAGITAKNAYDSGAGAPTIRMASGAAPAAAGAGGLLQSSQS